ncbi:MAG: cysteine desulfurase, partial [Gammaproteobacteria bacterium]|nr:cysteine desulfurase [Gammaproteobacteria bacterium]
MHRPIYLDYNATTPVSADVIKSIHVYLYEYFGNPSSTHAYGLRAREGVSWAREQLAELMGAEPQEIVFTGSASEANNMAILGCARALRDRGQHLITTAVEHPSVMQPLLHLQQEGWELTIIPVDEYGQVTPEDVRSAIRSDTVIVSIMHANNEVGTIQPIAEIAAITRELGIILHVDAAQSVGKIPVSVDALGVDLLTLAGHKFYAPKGVGALYIREGVQLEKIMFGAGQERGRRTGTENVPYIVGIGEAARLAREGMTLDLERLRNKRNRLYGKLHDAIPGLKLNGHPSDRLPGTLNVSLPGVDGNTLLNQLSDVL